MADARGREASEPIFGAVRAAGLADRALELVSFYLTANCDGSPDGTYALPYDRLEKYRLTTHHLD